MRKFLNGSWFIFVSFVLILSMWMIKAAYDNQPPQDYSINTVIVLGAKVNKTVPSVSLQKRCEAALDYAKQNPNAIFIVSGGQGKGEEISESAAMKNWLVSQGVDDSRIIEENQATNTGENLRFSLQLINQQQLSRQVVLITDNFHQLRTQILAQQLGLECYGLSAKTPIQLVPVYSVREWFGLIKAFVFKK